MEPFHPSFIEALKQQHPELTDETIARLQTLMARQNAVAESPELVAREISATQRQAENAELNDLLQTQIPDFESILQQVYRQGP